MKKQDIILFFKRIAIGGGFLVLITIGIYISNFWNSTISSSSSDWANLATYISGIIGTITSILSLVVLAYITLVVADSSTEENKNLFLLKHRIEAYEKLMTKYEDFKYTQKTNVKLDVVGIKSKYKESTIATKSEALDMLFDLYQKTFELNILVSNFKKRYAHIFTNIDFESANFVLLLSKLKELEGIYQKYFAETNKVGSSSYLEGENLPDFTKLIIDIFDMMDFFIGELKEEMT